MKGRSRRRGGRGRVRGKRPPATPEKPGLLAWFKRLFGIGVERAIPTRAQQESRALDDFQKHFRLTFADIDLLKLALTHRSYLSVTGQGPRESNERLEFLGDSVLGLVTSEFLYRENPEEHEGDLTKAKSLLVSKAILSRRALAMGLGRFVLMSHSEVESGGRQRLSILADAFEAVIGAVYLDQGFEPARAFIHRWLLSESGEIVADKRHTNYKSHLQEYVQSTWRTHPIYRIRSEMGPDHSKHFLVEVLVGKRSLGDGRGRNKKEAEQAAARNALERAGVTVGAEEVDAIVSDTETVAVRPTAARRRAPEETIRPAPEVDEDDEVDGDSHARSRRPRRPVGHDREERPADPVVETAPAPLTPTGRLAVPSNRLKPLPEPPAVLPVQPEKEPPPSSIDEDEFDDVGRPEGPLEELHVDPYAWGSEPPASPLEEFMPAESEDFESPRSPVIEDEWDEGPSAPSAAPPPAERTEAPARSRRRRESAPRESRRRESAQRSTPRESSPHESAPREIVPHEDAPREIVPHQDEDAPREAPHEDLERDPDKRPSPASFGRRRTRRG
ncbi:MAG: ribonuclease III [Candidatus Eisenbacteria bacterium]